VNFTCFSSDIMLVISGQHSEPIILRVNAPQLKHFGIVQYKWFIIYS